MQQSLYFKRKWTLVHSRLAYPNHSSETSTICRIWILNSKLPQSMETIQEKATMLITSPQCRKDADLKRKGGKIYTNSTVTLKISISNIIITQASSMKAMRQQLKISCRQTQMKVINLNLQTWWTSIQNHSRWACALKVMGILDLWVFSSHQSNMKSQHPLRDSNLDAIGRIRLLKYQRSRNICKINRSILRIRYGPIKSRWELSGQISTLYSNPCLLVHFQRLGKHLFKRSTEKWDWEDLKVKECLLGPLEIPLLCIQCRNKILIKIAKTEDL